MLSAVRASRFLAPAGGLILAAVPGLKSKGSACEVKAPFLDGACPVRGSEPKKYKYYTNTTVEDIKSSLPWLKCVRQESCEDEKQEDNHEEKQHFSPAEPGLKNYKNYNTPYPDFRCDDIHIAACKFAASTQSCSAEPGYKNYKNYTTPVRCCKYLFEPQQEDACDEKEPAPGYKKYKNYTMPVRDYTMPVGGCKHTDMLEPQRKDACNEKGFRTEEPGSIDKSCVEGATARLIAKSSSRGGLGGRKGCAQVCKDRTKDVNSMDADSSWSRQSTDADSSWSRQSSLESAAP